MRIDKPYFMENEEWYYFDEDEWCYRLTDKAPPRAVESFNEFYKILDQNNPSIV